MRCRKLFGTTDRGASHQKLAEILASGTDPLACCREDPNDPDHPYQVWSGGPEPYVLPPEPPAPAPPSEDELLDRLAEKLMARMIAKPPASVPSVPAPDRDREV